MNYILESRNVIGKHRSEHDGGGRAHRPMRVQSDMEK
jgi:hypothetical protein